MAELADALDLGSSVFDVRVQVPPRAPDYLCAQFLCGDFGAFSFSCIQGLTVVYLLRAMAPYSKFNRKTFIEEKIWQN